MAPSGHQSGYRSEASGRFRWTVAILLGAAGFLLNLLPVGLSPGTDLIFGGAAALLAAVTLGAVPGLLAGAIASVRTLWLWQHPYAWLIFSAEAFVVGLLVERWGRRPMVASLVYWVAIGVPLLFLTYFLLLDLSGPAFATIVLKQPLNGLVNAMMVEMLLLFPAMRGLLRLRGAPRLQSALAVIVATAAVLPALAFGVWVGQREWQRNLDRSRDRVTLTAEAYASRLEQYVQMHERAVRSVSSSAERRGTFDPEQLQRLISAENEQFRGFVDMYAADSRAVTVAFYPEQRPDGQPLLGLDFSDRPYFRELRETRQTVISDVFAGRGGVDEPLVIIADPIILADTLAGYVLGALDLKALPRPSPSSDAPVRVSVADGRGMIVLDSRNRYRPGELPRTVDDSAAFAAVRGVGDRGLVVYQSRAPATAAAPVLAGAQVLAGVTYLPSLDWWVWVEEPYARIQEAAAESYVRLFGLLIGAVLLTLVASSMLARSLSRPLLRLRAVAGALGAGELNARVGLLPARAPTEVQELAAGFDEMADALEGYTHEMEELAEIARSLASTLELGELLRRVIDAASRLVNPDGCGIALLSSDGNSLQVANYSTGLLAATGGQDIPASDSVVGQVSRTGRPLLVEDVAAAPESVRGYLEPQQICSVICAPLIGRSGALGALVAVRGRRHPHSFTGVDLRLLERLAGYAAVAVENARLLEAAESASRAKSDFIATMSHELRTPLNAVLGHLELLAIGVHGSLNDDQRGALKRIDAATRHLRGLIEEVLSFSRLEAGRAEVRLQETDLGELVREVGMVMEPLARDKGLAFEVACEDGNSLVVRTDPDKVRQILINLTGNAVKFTDRGSVQLGASAADGTVRLSVSDTGPGISEADAARLFRPFEQLHSGFSRPHGGTGLGLYLSARYAEIVGGRVEVSSALGKGSEFSLLLPRPGPDQAEEAA